MQQTELVAGDSLNFLTATTGYSAADGWVLKYRMVPRSGSASAIDITATAEGADHRVQVAASATANWAAGSYGWAAWVEKAGEKYTVQTGQLTVLADPRQAAPGADTRSTARRALDDAKAAMAAWNPSRRRFKIGDREQEFNSPADIIKAISYWEGQVLNEDVLAGRREKLGRRIYSRV